MPTVVLRQIPFTSDSFGKKSPFTESAASTKFLTLPRWKIHSALITDTDLGREEAARINFVQYYGKITLTNPDAAISAQTAAKNFVHDINDVTRSGLRPYIISGQFEDLSQQQTFGTARKWAHVIGDAVLGGHLKLNGTVVCMGLIDPIAVGDNLEYDDVVYHIEEVSHTCTKDAEGGVSFRTVLKLSNGVSTESDTNDIAYAEMTNTNMYKEREDNYNNGDKSLPGISEEQDTIYRTSGPQPTDKEIKADNKPFLRPQQIANSPKKRKS